MDKIAALVVTYNRKELLRRCIACLCAQKGTTPDIWVIDNASTDGTKQMVAALDLTNLTYRNTGANLGGAGGFAYAVEAAVQADYDGLWLMDDDTLPEPGALAALLQADRDLGGDYGWLSSRALAPDGGDQPMNRQRKDPYRDIDAFEALDRPLVKSAMASFVSLFLPAQTVRAFGLPIAEFFIWSDDWEYTRRISRQRPCYTVAASRVVHAMQNPTVVNIATDTPQRWGRYQYFYRNDVYLYRREGLPGWLWLLAKDVWHSAQVLSGRGPQKAARLKIIWRGFAAGVRFHPPIRYVGPPQQ